MCAALSCSIWYPPTWMLHHLIILATCSSFVVNKWIKYSRFLVWMKLRHGVRYWWTHCIHFQCLLWERKLGTLNILLERIFYTNFDDFQHGSHIQGIRRGKGCYTSCCNLPAAYPCYTHCIPMLLHTHTHAYSLLCATHVHNLYSVILQVPSIVHICTTFTSVIQTDSQRNAQQVDFQLAHFHLLIHTPRVNSDNRNYIRIHILQKIGIYAFLCTSCGISSQKVGIIQCLLQWCSYGAFHSQNWNNFMFQCCSVDQNGFKWPSTCCSYDCLSYLSTTVRQCLR